jgi:hypothetical protein
MTAFEAAWDILKSNTLEKQSYHPAIHGLMNRKRLADAFNVDMDEDFEGQHYGSVEEPYTMYDDEVPTMPNYEDVKHLANKPSYFQPSDFVDEAQGMGYEPKGASGPNSLRAAEQSGELKRQSRGLATRDAEARRRQGDFRNYPKFDYGANI